MQLLLLEIQAVHEPIVSERHWRSTKRCGGCHLDRYCSVECQTAMYPDHVGRCKRIQNKRAAPVEKKAA